MQNPSHSSSVHYLGRGARKGEEGLWFRIENSNIACFKEVDRPLGSQRRNEVALFKYKANVLSGLFSFKMGEY